MMSYINAVKRGFRDQHNFTPTGGTDHDPLFEVGVIPPGIYPMEVEGKTDYVVLTKQNGLSVCNKTREEAEHKFNQNV